MTHRSNKYDVSRSRGVQPKHKKKIHHPPPASHSLQQTNPSDPPPLPTSPPPLHLLSTPSDPEILQLIRHALERMLDSPPFNQSVQRVKSLLYDRKWLEVFLNPGLLEVYAGRWVPSRTLCYRELFASLEEVREFFVDPPERSQEGNQSDKLDESEGIRSRMARVRFEDETDDRPSGHQNGSQSRRNILALGGGAGSELLALAALVRSSRSGQSNSRAAATSDPLPSVGPSYRYTAIDIGAYSSLLDTFRLSLETQWDLPPSVLSVDFQQGSLLPSPSASAITPPEPGSSPSPRAPPSTAIPPAPPLDLPAVLLELMGANLITLLFTLSELLSQSRPSTISFLHSLSSCPLGTLLLVADSASDISDLQVGGEGRTYPGWMVLDHVLLSAASGRSRTAMAGGGTSRPVSSDGSKERGRNGTRDDHDEVADGGVGRIAEGTEHGEDGQYGQYGEDGQHGEDERRGEDGESKEDGVDGGPRPGWRLLRGENSRWFRLSGGVGLGWPVKFENTRYWYRLYRRV